MVVGAWQVPRDPDLGVDASRVQKEDQEKIDTALPLTDEEQAEKDDLLKQVRVCDVTTYCAYSLELNRHARDVDVDVLHCWSKL